MKRVLVLGGTGAMGEPLVKLLGERGDEVYVTSRKKRESNGKIRFIQGDAHDLFFMQQELSKKYDAVVDFMIYSTEDFKKRLRIYLKSTRQYLFLSSARVYADSKKPITENSPRILDVCKNVNYLKTDEYALAKTRSENVLFDSDMKNWTIIRPYITYNTKRLQLGGLELSTWLLAALSGRPLVLPKDVGMHETTMIYGDDVARAMVALIGNNKVYGEAFQITGTDHMKWRDVAEVYRDVIEEQTGHRPELYAPGTSDRLSSVMSNAAQIKYDRMYDRVFDNSKLVNVCGDEFDFIHMKDGLTACLKEYLQFTDSQRLEKHNYKFYAWLDKSTGRKASVQDISNRKDVIKYLGYYYAPQIIENIKKTIRN